VLLTKDVFGRPIQDGAAMNVWDDLVAHAQANVDFSHSSSKRHPEVFHNVNRVFKVLKLMHPEWVSLSKYNIIQ
jgi:hypothetical protein